MLAIYKIILVFVCAALIISCATKNHAPKYEQETKSTKIITSANFEKIFLSKVNIVRAKARKCGDKYFPAAPALALNRTLSKAAHKHSQDMYKHQFLEHTSSNGDTLVERMQDVKYLWSAVGENIAHNQKSIGQVLEDWLSSPGHCSNIMSIDYTQTGVANVNRYWTQVYAAPK